ncbi:predicted protein [Botrytis cinerea T4]|uniref:Uncharacterized protein n=1 Tax=Botryotinia fuckeliana (strain T4) TaxID=999810 RepID=G2YQU6_BOTF4|nr:predicted protein [Botrytis cinerea T4]
MQISALLRDNIELMYKQSVVMPRNPDILDALGSVSIGKIWYYMRVLRVELQ